MCIHIYIRLKIPTNPVTFFNALKVFDFVNFTISNSYEI